MTAVTNGESLPKVAKQKQTKTGIAGLLLFFTDKHKQNKREHSHNHHALFSLPSVFRNTMKKNKLLLCFRPLTDDDPIVPHARDSNVLLLSNDKRTESTKLKSDQEALRITRRRSRSLNASSRNFCNDFKSVLVEASMQQQVPFSFLFLLN
ncbi:hypothetical protein POM88_012316 [Heracleum sosnowskyi]|uniref:Uncharacterized protein n=1 Tax=Heracleum sosnowskyi TaxID=360622 RepID=A0AAD8IWI3_9APIA|nr:hypothetical protein POM88_012316 [Heracleum sosnowskyi]